MPGARAQQSGQGGRGACLLAAFLLCFSLLPVHAQDYTAPQRAPPTLDAWPEPNGLNSQSKVCGRTNFQGKIFGGQMAKPARWPWQASLLFRGSHICGGVLIDKNWVASAAHCFQRSRKPSDYRILLGYNNLGRPNNFSRQMTVNALIFHENYNKFYKQGSDIILIQLHKSVTYSSHILPACVPENTMNVPLDSSCWISGWGQLEEDKFLPAPFPLQEAEVLLVDDKECEEFFQTLETSPTKYKAIKEDMVCAGDISNERSICLGDSGGPLVCSLNGSWYVVGLASWSGACLEPVSSPNIFTKVSYFSDWIHNKKKETPDADPYLAPPEESAPTLVGWRSYGSDPATKPRVCVTLLSSQALLLPLIWLQIL
ncbi:serine protease 40 [Phodopus roborovskii]|uniref:Prss39 protein n=1 Tax=Phodopus roborovskii TaxID=109678 RepID=A0AAV0A3U1_PHORO|nr:serine protease 40 [Phodopus roborovskii]CAH7225770.1 Prss39 [Phodopus roborovskii]